MVVEKWYRLHTVPAQTNRAKFYHFGNLRVDRNSSNAARMGGARVEIIFHGTLGVKTKSKQAVFTVVSTVDGALRWLILNNLFCTMNNAFRWLQTCFQAA